MKKLLLAPLFGLLLSAPALAEIDPGGARVLGLIYCELRNVPERNPLEPFLSKPLLDLVDAAWAESDRIEKLHPGDKPPLGDGVQWQTWPDYVPECRPGEPGYMMDEAKLSITNHDPDYPEHDYKDTLWLVLVDGTWFINDIRFEAGHTLREALAAIIDGEYW